MHNDDAPSAASPALCAALRRIIDAAGLTAAEASRQFGCTDPRPFEQRLSTGQPPFSRDEIERIAQILPVSAAERVELLRLRGDLVIVAADESVNVVEVAHLEARLAQLLSASQRDLVHTISSLLAEQLRGALSSAELQAQLSAIPQISFAQAHTGNVTMGGVAGRDIIRIDTVQIILPPGSVSAPAPEVALPPMDDEREGARNPFIVGNAVPPERFYGREEQRQAIRHRIGGVVPQSVSLVGFRRSGKSSLLNYIHERTAEFCGKEQRPLVVHCSLAQARMQTPAALYEHLRRTIERKTGRAPWRQEEHSDPYALDDGLEALRDQGYRLIVLLDEFESIQQRLAAFGDWGNDWRERAGVQGHFALVIASVRPLEEIYQPLGLTSPFGNIFTTTELGPFETATWQRLVHDGFRSSGGASLRDHDLALLDELAGGLPYYTQLAAYCLWHHGDHQRTRAAFALQAAPRFQELWNDLRPDERAALRHTAELPGSATPTSALRARLTRHGLLRADGRVFSAALVAWLRGDER